MKIAVVISYLISLVFLTEVDGFTEIKLSVKHRKDKPGIESNLQTAQTKSEDTVIFVGPYNNMWGHKECTVIDLRALVSLSSCKSWCIQTLDCTAINFNRDSGGCEITACGFPAPSPQLNLPPWQGYAIAAACGTESKCGIKGGFCIPDSEHCNGNIIIGEGYCNANYKQMTCKCCFSPTVYMRDIENTIAYALRNRAPYNSAGPPPAQDSGYRTLYKDERVALSNFVTVLVLYLPLRPSLRIFLNCLSSQLPRSDGQNVEGEQLEQIYRDCGDNQLPYVREWVGCRNTDNLRIQRFRSYPCGVWTLFHAMTVDLTPGNQEDRILPTLYGMVDYFPWCPDCKAHFIHMYNNLTAEAMITAEEVTMWLWRAHNKVSVRVQDGFDRKDLTWETRDCESFTPDLNRLQTLLSACKFECKIGKTLMNDCKYIEVPSDDTATTCQICRAQASKQDPKEDINWRYSLNTAPENPGRRKSLFPDFKLCENCWELVEDYTNPDDFTTKTNELVVLSYLKELYKRDAIVKDFKV